MENSAIGKTLSDAALVFLFPFMLAIGHLSPGWNNEDIKKGDKIILKYQIFLPEKAEKGATPVIIVLKDKGGKLTANDVKLIEARSKALGKAVVIPKSPGASWSEDDSPLLSKLIADLAIKRSLNLDQVELISISSGAPVAVQLICTTQVKFQKVFILGYQKEIKECTGGSVQDAIYTDNDINKDLWAKKGKSTYKVSAKNLTEVFKL